MLHFIYGGGASGKSAYAEKCTMEYAKKYYIATMEVYGEEGKARVAKHRSMRAGKGFETIECPRNFALLRKKVEEARGSEQKAGEVALLECMSNLVANEMFCGEDVFTEQEVVEKVLRDLEVLFELFPDLVVVSNNIFEDGMDYPQSTKAYMRALAKVNAYLAAKADLVTEVVVGIPLRLK